MQLKRTDSHEILLDQMGYTQVLQAYRGSMGMVPRDNAAKVEQQQCANVPSMFILFSSPKDGYVVQWESQKTVRDVQNG